MAPTVEQAALCSAEATSSDDVDDADELIASLPPLPEPRRALLCRERLAGVAVVGSINGVLHVAARVAHHGYGFGYAPLWDVLLAIGTYETVFAFLALLAIHLVDAGVIRRSADRCLPLPPELAGVVKRLGRGRALVGVSNPTRDDGSSYCVRCFVWRRPPRSSPSGLESLGARCTGDMTPRSLSGHHCSTCGVCVEG